MKDLVCKLHKVFSTDLNNRRDTVEFRPAHRRMGRGGGQLPPPQFSQFRQFLLKSRAIFLGQVV